MNIGIYVNDEAEVLDFTWACEVFTAAACVRAGLEPNTPKLFDVPEDLAPGCKKGGGSFHRSHMVFGGSHFTESGEWYFHIQLATAQAKLLKPRRASSKL